MKRLFIAFLILLAPAVCWAETKEIITEYTYTITDETPAQAEEKALLYAKRQAIEQAGTWISSYTQTANNQFAEDSVKSITGSMVSTDILERKTTADSAYVKIKVTVKMDNLQDVLEAVKHYEEGKRLTFAGKYAEAIPYYTKAIELNSRYAWAYNNRGGCYSKIKKQDKALDDFNIAISLDSGYDLAYFNKGYVLDMLGQFSSATEYYKTFLQIARDKEGQSYKFANKRVKEIG